MQHEPRSWAGDLVNAFEETAIAAILGAMTVLTFINVFFRYVFASPFGRWVESQTGWDLPDSIIWGLEVTLILFAWLVLFGMSYAAKVSGHLGVDVIVNATTPPVRRILGILAAAVCLAYAFLLLKGGWDFWANFANLPKTTGRWFPTGFEEMGPRDYQGWYETVDVPMPDWLRWIEPHMLAEGDPPYEAMPRFIPYVIMPFGALLLLIRFVQLTLRIIRGEADRLIAAHEAEDALADVQGAR